jgi:hypothetical protein
MNVESELGTVTNNEDPSKGGAVKVVMTSVGGEEYPEWIEPIHPSGVFFHPEVGDTVEISRPAGDDITEFSEDVRYRGVHTSESEAYPKEFKENYPKRRGIKTKEGHTLILDDKTGDWLIKTFKGNHEIKLEGNGTITIKNGMSGDTIVMSSSGTTTSKATTKNHLDSPMTDLNSIPTDFLLKGTMFFSQFIPFLQAWSTLLKDVAVPPTDPNWTAHKILMAAAIDALVLAASAPATTWLSLTTRTS